MGAYIVYRSMGGTQRREQIWPLPGEEKKDRSITQVIDPELYKKIMERATGHKKEQ